MLPDRVVSLSSPSLTMPFALSPPVVMLPSAVTSIAFVPPVVSMPPSSAIAKVSNATPSVTVSLPSISVAVNCPLVVPSSDVISNVSAITAPDKATHVRADVPSRMLLRLRVMSAVFWNGEVMLINFLKY